MYVNTWGIPEPVTARDPDVTDVIVWHMSASSREWKWFWVFWMYSSVKGGLEDMHSPTVLHALFLQV